MEKENMVISALNLLIDLVIRADGMLLAKYHVVAIALIVSIAVSVIFIGQYFGMLCTKLHKAMLSYKASAQIKARKQARSAVMIRLRAASVWAKACSIGMPCKIRSNITRSSSML